MDVPLAFLLITLLLSLMHQISERRHSGLRAADKDKQRSEASMQGSFSIHHTLILPHLMISLIVVHSGLWEGCCVLSLLFLKVLFEPLYE